MSKYTYVAHKLSPYLIRFAVLCIAAGSIATIVLTNTSDDNSSETKSVVTDSVITECETSSSLEPLAPLETLPIDTSESEESTEVESTMVETDSVHVNTSKPTPTYYVELTDDEINMLASLVYLEGGIESVDCQKAICSVVLNRVKLWNMSLEEVIYQENQFTPAYLISSTPPKDKQISVVKYIMENGPTIPEYVCYFRAQYYHNWRGMNDYMSMDHTYFSFSDSDYQRYIERK